MMMKKKNHALAAALAVTALSATYLVLNDAVRFGSSGISGGLRRELTIDTFANQDILIHKPSCQHF